MTVAKEDAERIQTSFLNANEKKVLVWLAERQPNWMTSDILTWIGTLVDTFVLWMLSDHVFTDGFWGEYIVSPVISFQCAVAVNYVISYFFVWKDRTRDRPDASVGRLGRTLLQTVSEIQPDQFDRLSAQTWSSAARREVYRMGCGRLQPYRYAFLGNTELHNRQPAHLQEKMSRPFFIAVLSSGLSVPDR